MAEDVPSLLDQARASVLAKGPRCSVAIAIQEHPDLGSQITELIEACPTIPYATASSTLGKVGISLKPETLSRHKRNECACK